MIGYSITQKACKLWGAILRTNVVIWCDAFLLKN